MFRFVATLLILAGLVVPAEARWGRAFFRAPVRAAFRVPVPVRAYRVPVAALHVPQAIRVERFIEVQPIYQQPLILQQAAPVYQSYTDPCPQAVYAPQAIVESQQLAVPQPVYAEQLTQDVYIQALAEAYGVEVDAVIPLLQQRLGRVVPRRALPPVRALPQRAIPGRALPQRVPARAVPRAAVPRTVDRGAPGVPGGRGAPAARAFRGGRGR